MIQDQKPLRLWLGVFALVMGLLWFVVPRLWPEAIMVAALGGVFGSLAIVVWWVFFGRVPWPERWGAPVLMIVAVLVTSRLISKSIAASGRGVGFYFYCVPPLAMAFAVWAMFAPRLSDQLRRATMVATILLATGAWTLLRSNGINGRMTGDFAWRWAPTSEEKLLAQADGHLSGLPLVPSVVTPVPTPVATPVAKPALLKAAAIAEWPGYRGPRRDGVISGTRINTDWSASPPVELWRRPIGPGWSSFAVLGDLIYTQEQRGDDEFVTC